MAYSYKYSVSTAGGIRGAYGLVVSERDTYLIWLDSYSSSGMNLSVSERTAVRSCRLFCVITSSVIHVLLTPECQNFCLIIISSHETPNSALASSGTSIEYAFHPPFRNMVWKRHQKDISGALNAVGDAPPAADLPCLEKSKKSNPKSA